MLGEETTGSEFPCDYFLDDMASMVKMSEIMLHGCKLQQKLHGLNTWPSLYLHNRGTYWNRRTCCTCTPGSKPQLKTVG